VYQNTPLAVVEAKAWGKPLTEGAAQAKLYASKLGIRFAYATNGQGVYEIDMHTGVDARNVRNIVLMRPVGYMIEFKQIIGRGTCLWEGKDYFTIYDFVQAYKRFSDADWDGEAVAVADIAQEHSDKGSGEDSSEVEQQPIVDLGIKKGSIRSPFLSSSINPINRNERTPCPWAAC
jgi:type I site-specific restriction endonuclease